VGRDAENARHETTGKETTAHKMQGWKIARNESAAQKCRVRNCGKRKQRHKVAGVENARHEYSRKAEYRKPSNVKYM